MKIKSSIDDSIAIIEIEGSLSSEEKLSFEKEVSRYSDKRCHIILDLSKVTFIDSSSLGSIVKYYSQFQKIGRHLLLVNVNRQIYEVFNLTGITRQIKLFDTMQSAVDFIRANS